MNTPASVPRTLCIAAAIVSSACLSLLQTASAQTITDYLGTFDSATENGLGFSTGTNWSPSAPSSSLTANIARFNQTSYPFSTVRNAGYSLNGLIFGDGTTATAPVTISITGADGQQLRLGTGGIAMNANSAAATINKIRVDENQTWSNNSSSLLTVGAILGPTANRTLNLDGTGAFSIGRTLDGTGFAQAMDISTATVTLSGANTFTGGLTLSSGSLILGNNAALGGVDNVLTIAGGTLDVTAARTTTNNNAQNWNGDFTFAGTSTLNLGTGAVTLGSNRTVTVNASSLTVGGVIGDGGNAYSLTKAGAGTLVLTGVNTYSGGTTLSSGTLDISEAINALGSGTLTLGNGTTLRASNGTVLTYANSMVIDGNVTLTGIRTTYSGNIDLGNTTRTLTVENSPTNGNLATNLTGVISGNAGIVKQGTGILDLSNGGNTFTGDVSLNEGTLRLRNGGIGNAANKLLINGDGSVIVSNVGVQALALSNVIDVNADFALNAGGDMTLSGATNLGGATRTITLTGAATKALDGVISNGGLALVVDSGTVALGGANTFSGDTTVAGTVGVVNLTNSLALQNSTLVYGNSGGSVAFDGITEATFGGLSGDKALVLANTAAAAVALSVGNNNASTVYSGGLSGAGSLTKVGSGTLTLGTANTYAGQTVISAGTLALGAGGSIADSVGIFLSSATTGLDVSAASGGGITIASGKGVGGLGTITGDLTLATGAGLILSSGALIGGQPLTVTGAASLPDSFGIASLFGTTGQPFDFGLLTDGTYSLIANGSDFSNISNWGAGQAAPVDGGRTAYFSQPESGGLQITVVPEPSVVVLSLAAASLAAWRLRRRGS